MESLDFSTILFRPLSNYIPYVSLVTLNLDESNIYGFTDCNNYEGTKKESNISRSRDVKLF